MDPLLLGFPDLQAAIDTYTAPAQNAHELWFLAFMVTGCALIFRLFQLIGYRQL